MKEYPQAHQLRILIVIEPRTVARDVPEMAFTDPCNIQLVRFKTKERRLMIRALSRIDIEPEDVLGIEHS